MTPGPRRAKGISPRRIELQEGTMNVGTRVTRTAEGSGTSETTSGTANPGAGSSHRRASARTCVPITAQRCGSGGRRSHGRAIRRKARGESADAASTDEGGAVPPSTNPPGEHPEGERNVTTDRSLDGRGQDRAGCVTRGAGGHLRARFLGVLVRLPAQAQRARRDSPAQRSVPGRKRESHRGGRHLVL